MLQELEVRSPPSLSFDQARIAGARGEIIRQGDLLTEALKQNARLLPARLELSRLLVASGKARDAVGILDPGDSPLEKRTAGLLFLTATRH